MGRQNETTIEKGIGNGAPVFAFLVCFFILSSYKEPTSGENNSPGGKYL